MFVGEGEFFLDYFFVGLGEFGFCFDDEAACAAKKLVHHRLSFARHNPCRPARLAYKQS